MDIIISSHQSKAKSYSALVIAGIVIIMIYLMVDVAIYPRARVSIINLTAQEQGSPRISEVEAPLPVPTPPSLQRQVASTPIPPEPVHGFSILVPQSIPTPPPSQIP
jgi:hypothetical protein